MKKNILLIALISVATLIGLDDDRAKKIETQAIKNLLLGLQRQLPSGAIEKAKVNAVFDALNNHGNFCYQSEITEYEAAVLQIVKNTLLKKIF